MTGAALHLIRPFGFYLDEKSLKRSGLDYWHKINVQEYRNFAEFAAKNPRANIFLAETGGKMYYTQAKFAKGDFIVFGNETKGLPQDILEQHPEKIISIPMVENAGRSLNLSVSVGIILYEAIRQVGITD